jgi:hypothetical protein
MPARRQRDHLDDDPLFPISNATKVVISEWRIGMMFMLFSSHTSAGRECRVANFAAVDPADDPG